MRLDWAIAAIVALFSLAEEIGGRTGEPERADPGCGPGSRWPARSWSRSGGAHRSPRWPSTPWSAARRSRCRRRRSAPGSSTWSCSCCSR
ncbi:hypothetical protein [Nonomuraea recticatena]|uniref:hypothetical protein n=1 Tax=Nonomuraea recticatena TaxID=46178 RepID=UPI0036064AD2